MQRWDARTWRVCPEPHVNADRSVLKVTMAAWPYLSRDSHRIGLTKILRLQGAAPQATDTVESLASCCSRAHFSFSRCKVSIWNCISFELKVRRVEEDQGGKKKQIRSRRNQTCSLSSFVPPQQRQPPLRCSGRGCLSNRGAERMCAGKIDKREKSFRKQAISSRKNSECARSTLDLAQKIL